MRLRSLLLGLCLLAAPAISHAAPTRGAVPRKPQVHVVQNGQRLGSIAKRYNVSVEALCTANGIGKNQPIRPGQKLVIPSPNDKDGTLAAKVTIGPKRPAEKRTSETTASSGGALPNAERVHRVESGQRLGSIAKRYGVSVDALCEANRIRRTDLLKPGQRLVIPDGDSGVVPLKSGDVGPRPSATRSGRRGQLELYTYTARWRGRALDDKGRVPSTAVTGISRLLGATGTRPRIDPRLIRLLAQVSDHFGGRPIRVVSGYRTNSYYDDSRHRHSRAIDFSIPGVSNQELRDYLRRFERVGVGYYPNSSFVHLDVRESSAYWVDYSGPGEAPRKKPYAPAKVASGKGDADAAPVREDADDDEPGDEQEEREGGERGEGALSARAPLSDSAGRTAAEREQGPTRPASISRSVPSAP